MTDETTPAPAPAPTRAHVHVVRGAPDDVELAALVAGLAAVQVPDEAGADGPRSAWNDRARVMRAGSRGQAPGPDAWRWSLRG